MRRAPKIRLHWEQRRQLFALARGREVPERIARRARVVLLAAHGAENQSIATELGISAGTAGLWRHRFLAHGVGGLERDAPRPGRPHSISAEMVRGVLQTSLEQGQRRGRRSTVRAIAREVGLSKSSVHRILASRPTALRDLPTAPSIDPGMGFLERVTDLVGLYLNPSGRAVALCTDERLSLRAPPARPSASPRALRNLSQGAEFRAFLQVADRETPRHLHVHLLADSRLAPVPPEIQGWLARHPRIHLHILPADQVGLTFIDRLIEDLFHRRDRPGTSAGAHRLKSALRSQFRRARRERRPFVWTATSSEIRGAYGRRAIQ